MNQATFLCCFKVLVLDYPVYTNPVIVKLTLDLHIVTIADYRRNQYTNWIALKLI